MTNEQVRTLAQTDPTSTIVERWGHEVIATRNAVTVLEARLRDLQKATDDLAERNLVVATDLGPTGNAARAAYMAAQADAGTRGFSLPDRNVA